MKKFFVLFSLVIATKLNAQLTVSTTSVLCYGMCNGSATFSFTGNNFPYNITINSSCGNFSIGPINSNTASINGLCACVNNYNAVLTDNVFNVAGVASFAITGPAPIQAVGSVTNAGCGQNNGCISVTVTGGTPIYSFNWTPAVGFSSLVCGLASGAYTLNVLDGNGCASMTTYMVNQPPGSTPSVAVVGTNSAYCGNANGSATITASGGAAPYTYSWSTVPAQTSSIASAVASGVYSVFVTGSNSCVTMATVNIPSPPLPTATINFTSPLCFGQQNGSASITVAGASPFTYSWNPGGANTSSITGIGSGNYTCTIKDTYSCTAQKTVNITQPAAIVFTCSSVSETCAGCCNGSLTFSVAGGTAPYNFTVNPGAITGTSNVVTNLCAGNYSVTLSDANGCSSSLSVTVLSMPNGILESNLNIGAVNIQISESEITIKNFSGSTLNGSMFDLTGKLKIKFAVTGEGFYTFNKPEKGVYFFHFASDAGKPLVKKIAVN